MRIAGIREDQKKSKECMQIALKALKREVSTSVSIKKGNFQSAAEAETNGGSPLVSDVSEDNLLLQCLDISQPTRVIQVGPVVNSFVLGIVKEFADVFAWALMDLTNVFSRLIT